MQTRYLILSILFVACLDKNQQQPANESGSDTKIYQWTKIADTTAFMPSDRIQFMNIRDTFWALHPLGNYYSINGQDFILSDLEPKVSVDGNGSYIFTNNKLIFITSKSHQHTSEIVTHKSVDLRQWNLPVPSTTLPYRRSYHPIGFKGKIWIFGGRDSTTWHADAWNSDDAVHWNKVADTLPFGPVKDYSLIVFKKKLLLISDQLWDSEDGIHWKKISTSSIPSFQKSTPIQFNNLLWIFGTRSIHDGDARIYVSADTHKWDSINAPWPERASPAVGIFRGKIYLGGGNHRFISGKIFKDSLLNDVWQMEYKNPSE